MSSPINNTVNQNSQANIDNNLNVSGKTEDGKLITQTKNNSATEIHDTAGSSRKNLRNKLYLPSHAARLKEARDRRKLQHHYQPAGINNPQKDVVQSSGVKSNDNADNLPSTAKPNRTQYQRRTRASNPMQQPPQLIVPTADTTKGGTPATEVSGAISDVNSVASVSTQKSSTDKPKSRSLLGKNGKIRKFISSLKSNASHLKTHIIVSRQDGMKAIKRGNIQEGLRDLAGIWDDFNQKEKDYLINFLFGDSKKSPLHSSKVGNFDKATRAEIRNFFNITIGTGVDTEKIKEFQNAFFYEDFNREVDAYLQSIYSMTDRTTAKLLKEITDPNCDTETVFDNTLEKFTSMASPQDNIGLFELVFKQQSSPLFFDKLTEEQKTRLNEAFDSLITKNQGNEEVCMKLMAMRTYLTGSFNDIIKMFEDTSAITTEWDAIKANFTPNDQKIKTLIEQGENFVTKITLFANKLNSYQGGEIPTTSRGGLITQTLTRPSLLLNEINKNSKNQKQHIEEFFNWIIPQKEKMETYRFCEKEVEVLKKNEKDYQLMDKYVSKQLNQSIEEIFLLDNADDLKKLQDIFKHKRIILEDQKFYSGK